MVIGRRGKYPVGKLPLTLAPARANDPCCCHPSKALVGDGTATPWYVDNKWVHGNMCYRFLYPGTRCCSPHVNSDNVLNVPLCGYTCTRILYPVTNSVPTYLRLERPRRRGRSKRPGTLFVTGYNMRVHTANCYPTFPTFDAPNKSQRFFLFPRGYMRVPVYPTYPVAKGIYP